MKTLDVLLAIFMAFIWGLSFVIIGVGLDSFPPILFSAIRFFFAAFPFIFFFSREGLDWKTIISIGMVLGVVHYSLLYMGMSSGMPSGLSSLVIQIQVVFTVLLSAIILKDRPAPTQIAGISISLIGLILLVVDRYQTTSFAALLLIISAAAFLALSNILMKKSNVPNMLNFVIWMSIVPPIPLLILSLSFEDGQLDAIRNMSWSDVGVFIYASYFGTILATAILGRLIRKYSPNVVSPFFLLVPVFGMISSNLILGENLTYIEAVATLMVFSGLVFIVLLSRTQAQKNIGRK